MTDRLQTYARLKQALDGLLDISSYEFVGDRGVVLRGRLTGHPVSTWRDIQPRLEALGYIGSLSSTATGHSIAVAPAPKQVQRTIEISPQLSLVAFILTAISVIVTGAESHTRNRPSATIVEALVYGGLFMISILAILGAHELGHYVVARLRGEPVSPPVFIPLPILSIGGTMGAIIIQKAPFKNRRTLLEIGIAGPLAGFLVAIPILSLGLALTNLDTTPITPAMLKDATFLGESLLTRTLGTQLLGEVYIASDVSIYPHPFVLGAWFGLLVTGINLIPAGQLDGGHIAFALLGEKAKYLTYAVIAIMAIMTVTVSPAWGLWTLLLAVFGRSHPPVENPKQRLTAGHLLLALVGVLVLVLTFVPQPIYTLTP